MHKAFPYVVLIGTAGSFQIFFYHQAKSKYYVEAAFKKERGGSVAVWGNIHTFLLIPPPNT
jgi:predicted phosphodiesterase